MESRAPARLAQLCLERSIAGKMSLHERVRHVLNSLCEGNGVIEWEDHDFEIWLDSLPHSR